MVLGRDNNDDNFLKFESKYKEIFILILFIQLFFRFKHTRRWFGESKNNLNIHYNICLFLLFCSMLN
jgi:hypothetical protein